MTNLFCFVHRGSVGSFGRRKRSASVTHRDGRRVRGAQAQEQPLPRALTSDTRVPPARYICTVLYVSFNSYLFLFACIFLELYL